ncbi:MAG: hypothetical protein M1818_003601 [Claussenomyces sp. TS43310]|nr:MAG: hypothetical protein M1818_003601 [Claussenomyces sp. TS43310]
MKVSYLAVSLSYVVTSVFGLTPAEWRAQSIYQVLTDRFALTNGSTNVTCDPLYGDYCGGTWEGIVNKLDYIQDMGFTAIWISPIVENLPQATADGEGYHGYWAQNIYEVNTNFGSASDLVALSLELHSRNMLALGLDAWVPDLLLNDDRLTWMKDSYFHPFCLIDYNNATSIVDCWEGDNTVALADLRTEDSTILSIFESWVTELVANYTIDGLRIDSAREVDTAFFPPFETAAGVYLIGEVDDGDPNVVCPYQNYMSGVLNYPTYGYVTQAFQSTSGSISNLANGINQMSTACTDTTLLGSFLENHDQPRFPSYTPDMSLVKNAIAFTILADGIPIIYQGQEQHYSGGDVPENREAVWSSEYDTTAPLYNWIASLNQVRNQAIYKDNDYLTYKAEPTYSDESTIVMRKGNAGTQIVSLFTNVGASGSTLNLDLSADETGFNADQQLVEVLGCNIYTCDSSGNLAASLSDGLPLVFYPLAQLTNSSICASVTR